MQEFLKITSAINDESRVLILAFLKTHGELCVCDLQDSLGMIQSRLSRHLKILKEAGFLELKRSGVWAYYSVKTDLDGFCAKALAEIENLGLDLPKLKKISCDCKDEK
ncbi:ArsR/SmtB family transcription factor [Campylobacter lari]|uniref:ArsR/SmtB family transcription factor n=1 Tax=Campylobacter lari TaxID=201 RepID=UPI002153A1A8|nr:metalloregulator ArsR/SmtB family transcription factor [Campylobacter lari]MCR6525555.1 metalloregulator ArsR/SmtB family transcription factor [Campylobacter lari]MCR6776854.1 metalloregulator ArsR/SmtB family transcription factor [Campylobacter lari]